MSFIGFPFFEALSDKQTFFDVETPQAQQAILYRLKTLLCPAVPDTK